MENVRSRRWSNKQLVRDHDSDDESSQLTETGVTCARAQLMLDNAAVQFDNANQNTSVVQDNPSAPTEGHSSYSASNAIASIGAHPSQHLSMLMVEDTHSAWRRLKLSFDADTGFEPAATLPQELLPRIVGLSVDEDNVVFGTDHFPCWSLVCLDWANRCRRLMHKDVRIMSERSALRLRALVLGQCSDRLTPLVELIGRLRVVTNPGPLYDTRSWHHLLTTLVPTLPAEKFGELCIWSDLNRVTLPNRSIHWGVPPAVSAVPTPFRGLVLHRTRFASLHEVIRIVRSLPRLQTLDVGNVLWDDNQTQAPVTNEAHVRRARSTLTKINSLCCQNSAVLLLHTLALGPIGTPLHIIPPSEQTAIIQLVECIVAINEALGYRHFPLCCFEPFEIPSSQTGISGSLLHLDAGNHSVALAFYYSQSIVGCAILIIREEKPLQNLDAFASLVKWCSLALFTDLRFLIVGLSDVESVTVLAETHQELWELLGKRLHYHHFASQPEAGEDKVWVGRDPVSLEQTNERWTDCEGVVESLLNRL